METLKTPKTKEELLEFAEILKGLKEQIGFEISARGWCYALEQPPHNYITKAQFDVIENIINNKLRRVGILPIDFVAEKETRVFSGVERPNTNTPIQDMKEWLEGALEAEYHYTPNWWRGEKYYIQMVVEKIDLKTLFEPVCKEYHIPVCSAKGWQSMLMRAEYAKRFKMAESMGLVCVLLYCGDHDPDGLRISDFLRKNLKDIVNIVWKSGVKGYDPENLIIERFGLNYDFIKENNLTWIDNLITNSGGYIATVVDGKIVQGKTKAGRPHPNFNMDYAQEYLRKFGVRKCEANSLVVAPKSGRKLCRDSIERYLGSSAKARFAEKRQEIVDILTKFRKRTGLDVSIQKAIEMIDEEEDKEEGD